MTKEESDEARIEHLETTLDDARERMIVLVGQVVEQRTRAEIAERDKERYIALYNAMIREVAGV